MRFKRTITITSIMAVGAILVAIGIFRNTTPVNAQDQVPRPVPERISFGMVGVTSGQTVRATVADTLNPNDSGWPPGPTRVALTFRYLNGNLVRNRSGEIIRRVVDLERGDATFLDIDYDQLPPGPIRQQIRAVIVAIPPPVGDTTEQPPPIGERIVSSVEVINNANGRTAFVMFTSPAVAREFNPQPDPPLGE